MAQLRSQRSKKQLTFSCRKCLSSLSSLYVLLLNTGVEKGFMIFLMATEVLDSWSLAELSVSAGTSRRRKRERMQLTIRDRKRPYQRAGGPHNAWSPQRPNGQPHLATDGRRNEVDSPFRRWRV